MVVYPSLFILFNFFFQAEDGIRGLVRSRGLGDVYKRQPEGSECDDHEGVGRPDAGTSSRRQSICPVRTGQAVSYTHLTLPTIYPV